MTPKISNESLTYPSTDRIQPAVIEAWMEEHGAAIIRRLQRMGFTHDDAEDALQEAWAKVALRPMPRATTPLEVRGWLLRIARNAATDSIRKRQRERLHLHAYHDILIIQISGNPHTEQCWMERDELLKAAVETLTLPQILCVRRYLDFGTKADVANAFGISAAAAGKLLARAIARLKQHLTND